MTTRAVKRVKTLAAVSVKPTVRRGAAARATETAAMADRRARILHVAAKRFAEHGFAATTVREIADDVSILSGSLYHHFATKEEMLHEIVREPAKRLREQTLRIAKAPLDAEHRLVALILLDLGELTRNPEAHRILYNERKLFRRTTEFGYVLKSKVDVYHAWQGVLRDGVRAKLFKPDIDPHLAVFTTLRMLNTAADWYNTEDDTVLSQIGAHDLDRVADFYLAFILGAVRLPGRSAAAIPRQKGEQLARFSV